VTELLPSAVLWDMDGTLVDTEPYWMQAEIELVAAFGGIWTAQDGLTLVGSGLWASAAVLQDRGVALSPDEIVDRLTTRVMEQVETEVPWRPGALELLTDLRARGVRCALVTMSYRRFVAPILETLPEGTFEIIVTGDSVSHGKPHPEPYLKAAAFLGVDPAHTVAIEDSNTGARSAEAAGCTVLVVQNHVPVLPGERRVFADTLAGMRADDLPVPTATETRS
jgi:HAD superfamily hydrolase (TIGR01509 family)